MAGNLRAPKWLRKAVDSMPRPRRRGKLTKLAGPAARSAPPLERKIDALMRQDTVRILAPRQASGGTKPPVELRKARRRARNRQAAASRRRNR